MSNRNSILLLVLVLLPLLLANSTQQSLNLRWNRAQRGSVDNAIKMSEQNPVGALIILKRILDGSGGTMPNRYQTAWLKREISSLQPRALAILQKDFDDAKKIFDLRGMTVALAIAYKISEDGIETGPDVSEIKKEVIDKIRSALYKMKGISQKSIEDYTTTADPLGLSLIITSFYAFEKKLLTEASAAGDIWKITDVKATFLEKPYKEETMGGITISPYKGMQLMRVHANVENISDESDKEYSLYAFDGFTISARSPFFTGDAYRWMDKNFISLLLPESTIIECTHICNGYKLAGQVIRTISGGLAFPAVPVARGENMELDLLFNVPRGVPSYKLYILGSVPKQIKMQNE